MNGLFQDIRYSARRLVRQPVFVAVAVVSLAVGIGVNTAIFSIINSLFLEPVPLREPDRSVVVFHVSPENRDRGTSFAAYQQYRERRELFAKVTAISGGRPLMLSEGERREQVYAELATADFFSIADITLQVGRPFTEDAQFEAVLSHAFWQRRFGADPAIVGKTINLSGIPFTAIGVAVPGFTGLSAEDTPQLWIPVTTWARLIGQPERLTSDEHWLTTVALLQPGVSLQQADAALAAAPGEQTKVRSARQLRSLEDATDLRMVAAGALAIGLLVLALACTNVANLLIASAAARQRETSIRAALGATRARLLALSLSESMLLCLLAGAGSYLVASWLIGLVVAFEPPQFIGQAESSTPALDFHIDVRIFAFILGISVLTAILIGCLSSLHTARPANRRFGPGLNARSAVIVVQMALSLLLLVPCGLFIQSGRNALQMSPGFSTDHVIVLPISSDQGGVRVNKPDGFDQLLADHIAALPGVESATVMDPVPLWFNGSFARFQIDDSPQSPGPQRVGFTRIAPGYFETLRIPLLRGRDFTRGDNASAPHVAIVNETMARRFWPAGDALGKRLEDGDGIIEVVGIARDAKYMSLAEASTLWMYLPLAQNPSTNVTLSLAARVSGDPLTLRPAIEREVKALVPAWPMFQFHSLDEGLELQRQLPRVGATVLGGLGLFGLFLAAIGIYGVMAYVVRQRTRELGIRLALGAPAHHVLGLVIRQGMAVCLVGTVIGLAAAIGADILLRSLVFGVAAGAPLIYSAVLLILGGTAFLACYLPSRKVLRTSVLVVLRSE